MEERTLELLETISQLEGVPGAEEDIRAFVRERLDGVAEFETDNLGSLVCKKVGESDAPKIMIPAHMDEIGFSVKDITDEGYLKFAPLGGWLDQTLLAHRVRVRTRKGDLMGVIGCTPPHMMPPEERKKVIKRKDMFIDVGADDKEHAQEKLGVRIGDPIVPVGPYERLGEGQYLMSKAWDDRVGLAAMIELLLELADEAHPNTVYGSATVQEEVGTRGAETAADVVDPDFCVVLDVGPATDVPGVKNEVEVALGDGPIIYVLDAGTIGHRKFTNFVIDLAEELDIPHQLSMVEGGATDARAIGLHKRGVPSVLVGIPTRYIHSHAGIIHTDDYDATRKLVLELVKRFSADVADELLLG